MRTMIVNQCINLTIIPNKITTVHLMVLISVLFATNHSTKDTTYRLIWLLTLAINHLHVLFARNPLQEKMC